MSTPSSPLLDLYNQTGMVSDPLQRALDGARAKIAPAIAGGTSAPPGIVQAPGAYGGASAPAAAPAATAPPTAAAAPPVSPTPPPPPKTPNEQRLADIQAKGSGISQIHNPWIRTPLKVLDAIGSALVPGLTIGLPGTQYHHIMAERNAQRAVAGDEATKRGDAEAQNLASEVPLHAAQATEANARAESLANPKPVKEGGTVHEDGEGNMWVVHPDGSATAVAPQGGPQLKGKPGAEKAGTVHEDGKGNMWLVKDDGTATPITPKGSTEQLAGKVAPGPEGKIISRQVNGKPHNILVEGATGKDIADLGEKGNEPKEATEGTWSMQEGTDGKPVLFNSKTGATRAAPANIQPKGTAAKIQPAHDALSYAEEYLKGGSFTGPSDEALMEKFFELAKPSTGFRMSQPQQNMLMQTRDLVQGATAKMKHAFTPDAPYFDDQQRKNIVQTMRDLAKAKGISSGGAAASAGKYKAGDTKVVNGVTYTRDANGVWTR